MTDKESMEVVFIDPNDKQRSLYRIYLENILDDCIVHEFFNLKTAQDFLEDRHNKKANPIAFILASFDFPEQEYSQFYNASHSLLKTIPFVAFGEIFPEEIEGMQSFYSHHPNNSVISLPISPADFREKILSVAYPDRMSLTPVPAFQKVRLFNFYRFNKPHCHVYIKLSRMKYVKVFNQGTKYSRTELDKLKAKNVEYLYIRNEDFQKFKVDFFRNNFLEFDAQVASSNELKEKLDFTHAMLHELVLNLGFSKDAIELTEKSLKAINGLIEKCGDDLKNLVEGFRTGDDYFYDHSFLTTVICCDILRKMNFYSEERMEVLGLAALFHDITLKNPTLAKISHKSDPDLNKFSEKEVKNFLRHPLDAFDLILEYPNIPSQVGEVICQHHETPHGDGFPAALRPSNIFPLSAIFIIAHDFVASMEKVKYDDEKLDDVINKMKSKYLVSPFKEPLKAFLENREKGDQKAS
ncbi:MAG: HD domain-containing protein [Halobacteriovoraceae bacterium]|nr:HD domain-containing protein [Halobacteriovoraceae bacterium]